MQKNRNTNISYDKTYNYLKEKKEITVHTFFKNDLVTFLFARKNAKKRYGIEVCHVLLLIYT